jgi:F0F1-type ATP synthase assembly protein I
LRDKDHICYNQQEMTKTTAPTKAPSPTTGDSNSSKGGSINPRAEFIVAALNMSWQLAIVVLVPIIGGYELDKALDTLPSFTILGFLIAMIGMALVVWRQMQLLNPESNEKRS